MRSTNDQSPFLGPGFPLWPPVDQIVQVTGPAVLGTSPPIYPGSIVQWVGASPRPRSPCYVQEPNGIPLGFGYYDGRIVNAFNGAPLVAVTCCPTGSSSSSGR